MGKQLTTQHSSIKILCCKIFLFKVPKLVFELQQSFSIGAGGGALSPKEVLVISVDVFGCHNRELLLASIFKQAIVWKILALDGRRG